MFAPSIYWVKGIDPYRLALMPRPRGGEWLADEVAGWRKAGIVSAVSLLEPGEVRELELKDEAALRAAQEIEFRSFPIPDRGLPTQFRELNALLAALHQEVLAGKAVAIHCRAGIGRTGLMPK